MNPGLTETRMSSSLPTLSNSRWAVGRSNPARVAPPSELELPNRTKPEIRIVTTGPMAWTPIRCPARRLFLAAVLTSTTTSSGPGQWPLTSSSELNCGRLGSTLNPRLGAPPKAMALPFLISWGLPATPPRASRTSGRLRTFASSDSGNDGVEAELAPIPPPPAPVSIALRPVTVASVPR